MNDSERVAAALPAYEIGAELGRGGWGIVLAGRHRHLQRDVAIKQLPSAFSSDPDVRARFVTEARLLASLDHPHIVPIYDFVERDGLCLLVMEKLSGGTVWKRFVESGLEAEEACAIALVTAVALEYAHQHGVLHRDVKPENMLLTDDGRQLKVGDFGTARVLAGSTTMATQAGEVVGTPAYMAPEQATGSRVTPATDVYALGMTLYEMMSGQLPFRQGDSPLALLYQRVHEAPIPIAEVAPEVPTPVADVIMAAIRTEPGDRPPTAEAFAVELAKAATGAFGRGWFEQTGLRGSLGTRLAGITTRESGVVKPPTTARVRPDRTTRVVERGPDIDPTSLVPVAEITAENRDDSLHDLRLLLARSDSTDAQRLAREIERAESTAHELHELALLRQVRSGSLGLDADDNAEIERLVGASGYSWNERVGLGPTASAEEIRDRALGIAARWKRRAAHPLSSRALTNAAADIVRAAERVVAEAGVEPGRN
jgi:serine/threonine protein kinase